MGGKKLYKSETNKKIAGVCGGVADYFEIDPTIVRIIWFVVTWFYGIGVILYIAGALILPNESIAKAQMAEEAARPAPDVHVEPANVNAAPVEVKDVHFDVKPEVQPAEPEPAAKPVVEPVAEHVVEQTETPAAEAAAEQTAEPAKDNTVIEFNIDEPAE